MKVIIDDECKSTFSSLTRGAEYEVLEVVEHEGEEYYMIVDDDEDNEGEPVPYLADGFLVVENDVAEPQYVA